MKNNKKSKKNQFDDVELFGKGELAMMKVRRVWLTFWYNIGKFFADIGEGLLIILAIILPFVGFALSIWWLLTKCTDGINGFWDVVAIIVFILTLSIFGAVLNE
jgi:hypothetical protein